MISEKYGRTYHYPFSPGTTSDDRINHTYWEDIQRIRTLVHTEKLDGENNCLGVIAMLLFAPPGCSLQAVRNVSRGLILFLLNIRHTVISKKMCKFAIEHNQ